MDRFFLPAFGTAHATCRQAGSGAAARALYVRSHWLRMPVHLLLPHLAYKAWLGATERWRENPADQEKLPRPLPGPGEN